MAKRSVSKLSEVTRALYTHLRVNSSKIFTTAELAQHIVNLGIKNYDSRNLSPLLKNLAKRGEIYQIKENSRRSSWKYKTGRAHNTGKTIQLHHLFRKIVRPILEANPSGIESSELIKKIKASNSNLEFSNLTQTMKCVFKDEVEFEKVSSRSNLWKLKAAVSGNTVEEFQPKRLQPKKLKPEPIRRASLQVNKSEKPVEPIVIKNDAITEQEATNLFADELKKNIKSANRSVLQSLLQSEYRSRVKTIKSELLKEAQEIINSL